MLFEMFEAFRHQLKKYFVIAKNRWHGNHQKMQLVALVANF